MTQTLPLVKLSVLRPFAMELRERGVNPEPVFSSVGLTEGATWEADLSVHVMVIHQFVENAAKSAKDPYFGARVGSKLDVQGWPVLADAEARASTVGDYLSIFIARANEIASSVTEYLNVAGQTAVFGETRSFEPTIQPAQNDAFMAALGWAILRRALNDRLDPSQVTMSISDPGVLPPEFDLMHPIKGDRMGFSIRFPSSWLSLSLDAAWFDAPQEERSDSPPSGFVHAFRQMLRAHIGEGGLNAAKAAALASMSQHKLKRRLAANSTDITSEIGFVKQELARETLAETDRSISDIATALGFTDAANFTRAFRRANGMTPTTFRKLQKTGDDESTE
ncbi:helix-turn-helix domain-containing protein [Tropicimonas sp. TH_r6]|uniref:AraC family transcriptional regulator n=1 Tax=Tropicimonas sp. TH_r6 TaxID=3082085 RepID=UPI00295497DF|nr:helix-turn-helix domain-containing protein [Tropicimonas sp. TH_r6]MDV7142000.1 helix-turn-helix domain-containing protein [Tropicimonas sp. TH_r6]